MGKRSGSVSLSAHQAYPSVASLEFLMRTAGMVADGALTWAIPTCWELNVCAS